jgi:selenide,water dikinase
VLSALRANDADAEDVRAALASMETLNRDAAHEIARINAGLDAEDRPVHACTDVTGFGLLAHASEMAGSAFTILLDAESLPLLHGASEAAQKFYATAGGQRNRNYLAGKVDTGNVSAHLAEIAYDPQTSGGLLIAVDPLRADELCAAIRSSGGINQEAAIIGAIAPRKPEGCYSVELL